MKTQTKIMLTMLTLGASALIASAQNDDNGAPPDGPRHGGHRPPPLPLVAALDANHDGVIDSNEIANASAELLTLDKNGDGILTTNEYLPPLPPHHNDVDAPDFKPPTPAIVKALDANGDGVIDADEIANASTALKTLDKNGDGQLTPDEFIGPRPHRDGPPDGDDHQAGPPPEQ
ncbi:MAG TPA: hypothetical protein VHG71_05750 [Verrucomicrobiae bacterium]|nr:hypothetical protein [Verrucomicrobiae bacterium]